mgnify:CR=1 FL=1
MSHHVNNGFARKPLGRLAPSEAEIEAFQFARKETLTDTSTARKVLLEDCASGYITKQELHDELLLLKEES